MQIKFIGTLFFVIWMSSCKSTILSPKYCYFKVDLNFSINENKVSSISCVTLENGFKEVQKINLQIGDFQTDSSFLLSRMVCLGKSSSLKKYTSIHINLKLMDGQGNEIQKMDGEIDRSDWICK